MEGVHILSLSHNQIINRTFASISLALVLLTASGVAYADSFDDQIRALQAQSDSQQAQANALHQQADTLANKLAGIRAQAGALQTQINLTQAKSNQTAAQIEDAKGKIATQKTVLGDIIKTMYFDSSVSPLEMLASSNNISDFLDNEQYRESLKQKIQSAMADIVKLKKSLEDDQVRLDQLLTDQKGQRQQLAQLQQQTSDLLASTQGQEALYQQQVAANNAKISQLRAQQAAVIAAASHHVSGGSGCGGYPATWCNSAQDTIIDSWGMFNRECVSYAAWATAERFGKHMPYWGGHGNANQWPGNARADGIPVDGTPHVGDVAIYMGGAYGHAMIVEQVKGSTVVVSSFNADNTGHYSVDEWATSSLYFIHFR